jgi:hypothetical protein
MKKHITFGVNCNKNCYFSQGCNKNLILNHISQTGNSQQHKLLAMLLSQ